MGISQELREKRRRIDELLDRHDLEGLYLKLQANFAWATGGGTNTVGITSEVGSAGLLFTRNGDFAVCNNIEAPRMLGEEKLESLGFKVKSFEWHTNRELEIIAGIVPLSRLGADTPVPEARLVRSEVARLRFSLTATEVRRYTELSYLSTLALETTAAEIRPGDRECEIIGRLAQRLWADRIDIVTTFCAADERISLYRHPVATEKRIEKRAMLGVNARRHGLIVCLTRFVQFGQVPAALKKQYRDNVELDCILWSNTVAGRPVQEAFQAVKSAYDELGYPHEFDLHHQGGSIGYAPRDYRVDFSTDEIIRTNQPFCWNPSITGTKSEDTILAASGSPVPMTKPVLFPKLSLEVKGVSYERPDILAL